MYLRREEVQELLDNMLSSIEQEIGEKHEFLYDLIKQDDWTFVIKAHALIEAAMTQMLVDHLGEPRLTN
jgi:hypothetical protein